MALVHDYLTQRGGAERVVLNMARAFPGAALYTSLYEPASTYREFAGHDVRVSPLNRIGVLRRRHRWALPLLAPSFTRLQVPGDVVLCSSSGWAHGIRTDARKIVYCHSPAKWLYAPDRYFSDGWSASRLALNALRKPLLGWDRAAAASADRYLVNSSMVQRWVRQVYGVEADLLPPPHGVDAGGAVQPVNGVEPGFLLCVSRLMPYKNVGAVVHAMAGLPAERLVVVGTGPLEAMLRAQATANVMFLGEVMDDSLRWLYRSCQGLVAASNEDFGLTPVEAAAFGKPVAVLRWGGFLDTVVDGTTGTFFDQATPDAVASALRALLGRSWDAGKIRVHAEDYSPARFEQRLREIVADEAGRIR